MLQQTRVAQGLPFYKRFVATFPTIDALAQATEEEVLKLWQGLGYYRRARNLHKCARHIVKTWGGTFPKDYQHLRTLPGIGPYTAAAIASIAFQEPVAAIDGNVSRVLSRIFGIEEHITQSKTQRKIALLAEKILNKTVPGDHNQALMEFGALCCTPKKPKCDTCIFQHDCIAKQQGRQLLLPNKVRQLKIKHRYFHYLLLKHGGQLYLKKRIAHDIWQHLYDFHLIETKHTTNLAGIKEPILDCIHAREIPILTYDQTSPHQLTHQRIHARFYAVEADKALATMAEKAGMRPFTPEQLTTIPMPQLIVNFLRQHPQTDGNKTC